MNSNFIAEMPSHGENRGSSPLGSAMGSCNSWLFLFFLKLSQTLQ